ncbi:MAG: hypothetical protein JSU72_01765 [Deltaproteobacteria bacterium]|nr:MAG: hypothetical protein JSU72_01765 [Deltaproteobacteria bacterium]
MKGFSLYIPGIIFIILGLLVVLFPMLLVGLFSAILILLGIAGISLGHRLRRTQRHTGSTMDREYVGPATAGWGQRIFVHRRW